MYIYSVCVYIYIHLYESVKTVLAASTCFFSTWIFFHEHSRFIEHQGKGDGISLTLVLHRHLDVSRVITAEKSPLNTDSSRTQTGNLSFLSPSRELLSYGR